MSTFTDANDFEKSIFKNFPTNACNDFSFAYVEENENAVVKVGEGPNGDHHCWVVDHGLNLTIDATLSQFDGVEDGYWEGTEHPHCEEWEEWTDKESFVEKYDAPNSPFIV